MPQMKNEKKKSRQPKLRLHKHSNRAYVELSGKRVYLGKWDDPKRDLTYHSVLAAWERNGRVFPFPAVVTPAPPNDELTVVDVCAAFQMLLPQSGHRTGFDNHVHCHRQSEPHPRSVW